MKAPQELHPLAQFSVGLAYERANDGCCLRNQPGSIRVDLNRKGLAGEPELTGVAVTAATLLSGVIWHTGIIRPLCALLSWFAARSLPSALSTPKARSGDSGSLQPERLALGSRFSPIVRARSIWLKFSHSSRLAFYPVLSTPLGSLCAYWCPRMSRLALSPWYGSLSATGALSAHGSLSCHRCSLRVRLRACFRLYGGAVHAV